MRRRVPEVLDCWFEAGSMPFAQVHYPFENRQWFENHFPADFITEYQAQTRGWFYLMMVLSTALFDRPPFENCLCHGVVLAEDGKKLSKRLRNYPDPEEVFESIGSDALRWFLVSSPVVRGGDLEIDREGKAIADAVRLVINPIWNAYYFFTLYANSDGVEARLRSDAGGLLDRYILARTHELVAALPDDFDRYDLGAACGRVVAHIAALNNWYIRRGRPRCWKKERDADKQDAYDTLYTALVVLCRAVSPLLRLVGEEIHRGLTSEQSVHLCDWPDALVPVEDASLVAEMDRVREVCSAALALRSAENVRVRQPLARLVIAGANTDSLRPYLDLIADEVNVKRVELAEDIEQWAQLGLRLNSRVLGPRMGKRMKALLAASKQGRWRRNEDGVVVVEGVGEGEGEGMGEGEGEPLREGEYDLTLQPREGVACQALAGNAMIAVLDLALTPELTSEGLARDVVRAVQQARKQAGLHVADRIRLVLPLEGEWREAVERHRDFVADQTLAAELVLDEPVSGERVFECRTKLGESEFSVGIERLAPGSLGDL